MPEMPEVSDEFLMVLARAARQEALEEAAKIVDELAREVEDNIECDGDLHVEGANEIKPLPHALRWLKHASAAVRSLKEI